ncbi:MAG: ribonuclease H-like domain-containing protein [Chloroflexi bacterium]|nr:ribonuclease H-like domain-containing protein [Chloroflexota bacterium]
MNDGSRGPEGHIRRAYLDIETTFEGAISVIGIYRGDRGTIQLIGGGVRDTALYDALEGVDTLVTFNGTGFDLPVIRRRMYIDLRRDFDHCDLMYVCRRRGLRGGLKVVEPQLGIERSTAGISGWDAPRLWDRYESWGDQAALHTLLAYNREDVINLAFLEERLGLTSPGAPCMAVRHVFA